jgi:hypothetical protein
MAIDARDLRLALRCVAHVLDGVVGGRDWRDLSVRDHLALALQAGDRALTNAHGGDHLAEAAARLLLALEGRERAQMSAEELRANISARRAR